MNAVSASDTSKKISDLQFFLEKLTETEKRLKQMFAAPQKHYRSDYMQLLSALKAAIELWKTKRTELPALKSAKDSAGVKILESALEKGIETRIKSTYGNPGILAGLKFREAVEKESKFIKKESIAKKEKAPARFGEEEKIVVAEAKKSLAKSAPIKGGPLLEYSQEGEDKKRYALAMKEITQEEIETKRKVQQYQNVLKIEEIMSDINAITNSIARHVDEQEKPLEEIQENTQ